MRKDLLKIALILCALLAGGVSHAEYGNDLWEIGDNRASSATPESQSKGPSIEPTCRVEIRTVAGDGTAAFKGDGGAATRASLNGPTGVALDSAGHLYIVDSGNFRIRKVDRSGTIKTVADLTPPRPDPSKQPRGITINSKGHIVFGDNSGIYGAIREIDGSGQLIAVGGLRSSSLSIYSLTFGNEGNLYYTTYPFDCGTASGSMPPRTGIGIIVSSVTDQSSLSFCPNRIQMIQAGDLYKDPKQEYVRHYPFGPKFLGPAGLFYEPQEKNLYLTEAGENRVHRFTSLGPVSVAGTGLTGWPDGWPGLAGNCGPATEASVYGPLAMVKSKDGLLFIADTFNNRIRKVGLDGNISVYAGNGKAGFLGDAGDPVKASLNRPEGLALDDDGNLYVADTQNNRVRMISCVVPLPDPITETPPPFEASGQAIPAQTIDSAIPGQTLDTAPAPAMKSSDATDPSQSVYVGTWESVGGALTTQTAPALMTPRSGVPIQTGAGIDPSTLGLYGKYVSKPPIEFTVTPEFGSYDFKPDLFAKGDIKFTATFRNNSDEPVTVSASYAMNVHLSEDADQENLRQNLKMVPQTRLISWHETPTSLAARKLVTLDPGEEFEFDFNGIADCYDYDAAVADGCRSKDSRDILPRCIIYNITERGAYKLSFTYQYEGIDLGLPNISREAIHSEEVTIHVK